MPESEIWKDVVGYEGFYKVSNKGNVHSVNRRDSRGIKCGGRALKPAYTKAGYLKVVLCKNGMRYYKMLHRLVAETFIPNPNNYTFINHIDNNPQNNIINNLEWCTQSYNIKYAYLYGNAKPTKGCFKKNNIPYNRKKVNQYSLKNEYISTFNSIKEASQKTNTNAISISQCCKNKQKTANGYIWRYSTY